MRFAKAVVKHRVLILILAIALMVPSVIGMAASITICSIICRTTWTPSLARTS